MDMGAMRMEFEGDENAFKIAMIPPKQMSACNCPCTCSLSLKTLPIPHTPDMEDLIARARAQSIKAARFVPPKDKEDATWEEMSKWNDHFLLKPELPLHMEWDFSVNEMEAKETHPRWLYDIACRTYFDLLEQHPLSRLEPKLAVSKPLSLTSSSVKLGLCTCVMNRGFQVKLSLPITIANCWSHREWCKIYIVDFNSQDGIVEWIKENFQEAIDVGLLNLYTCPDLTGFHAATAKKYCSSYGY